MANRDLIDELEDLDAFNNVSIAVREAQSSAARRAAMGAEQQRAATRAPKLITYGHRVVLTAAAPLQRILSPNLQEIEADQQWKPGAWVVAMQAKPPGGGTFAQVNAEVSLGAGGVTLPVRYTIGQGTVIQVPAAVASVDVRLIETSINDMIVEATVQRGFATTEAILTERYLYADPGLSGLIPPFARGVRISQEVYPRSFVYTNEALLQIGYHEARGTELAALAGRNEWFPVRASGLWSFVVDDWGSKVFFGDNSFQLDWLIDLG